MNSKDLDLIIDIALSALECRVKKTPLAQPINHYKRCHLVCSTKELYSPDWGVWMDGKLSDLTTKLDFSILNLTGKPNFETSNPDESFPVVARRIRQITIQEARGKINEITPTIIESSVTGFVPATGKACSTTQYFGITKEENAMDITNYPAGSRINKEATIEDFGKNFQVAVGWQFNDYYCWNIIISLPKGLSIAFETNAVGARELFKMRSIPFGKIRRTPLKNWVSEHWRTKRDEISVEQKIRKHLRGNERFSWGDYLVEIRPSKDAIEQNKNQKLLSEIEKLKKENIRLKNRPTVRHLPPA